MQCEYETDKPLPLSVSSHIHPIAAYIFAIALYLSVTVPALRTIVDPVEEDTREDRIEAMRVLAAGNTIIVVLLGAILALQVSERISAVFALHPDFLPPYRLIRSSNLDGGEYRITGLTLPPCTCPRGSSVSFAHF